MKNIKNMLKKPSRESKPWAIWIWNLTITQSGALEQLQKFIDDGFGGIAIRPSRDMYPVYLSEGFLILFEAVLHYAKERDISIRIADDFSLPWSGVFSADMAYSEKMRAQHIQLVENHHYEQPQEINLTGYTLEQDIVLAVCYTDGAIDLASVQELPIDRASCSVTWTIPEGQWRIMVFRKLFIIEPSGGFIPNIFNPKCAATYQQDVLEVFKAHFSKYIPSTFEGFINELPTFKPGTNTIPWDDDVVIKYRSKSKKDMVKLLPALFCDHCPTAPRIRQQIYTYIYQSMHERFTAPLEAWAKKNRFSQWVLSPERSLYQSGEQMIDCYVPSEPDLTAVGFQNIDGVSENYALLRIMADANTNEFRRQTITVLGRNRTGLAATLQSLKADIDKVLLSGFSHILIDGFFYSIDQRSYCKTPFNPSWYTPGNDQIRHLCSYSARSMEILKNAHWARQVAVLAPTAEILASYLPDAENQSLQVEAHLRLQSTLRALDECGISYDLVSDALLTSCTVRTNGEFGTADRIRKGNYQALIVPFAPDISRNVLLFIEKMVQKEGKILFVESAPRGTIEDGVSPTMTSRIEKILADRHKGTGVVAQGELEETFSSLATHPPIVVNDKITSGLYRSSGSAESAEIILLHNVSDTGDQHAVLDLPEQKHFSAIDCETGTITEIEPIKPGNGRCELHFTASPKSTVLILASPDRHSGEAPEKMLHNRIDPFLISERSYRIVLKDQWEFSTASLNALPLSNWNVRIGLSRELGGYSHFYESHFQVKALPTICSLVLNTRGVLKGCSGLSENELEVTVNGSRIDVAEPVIPRRPEEEGTLGEVSADAPPADKSLLSLFGKSTITYPIRDFLVRGFNRISIRSTGLVTDSLAVHYPPLVLGDFLIVKGQNGWAIDRHSGTITHHSWTKHGYPYLCGRGVYRQSFEIPNDYKKLVLRLSSVSGTTDVKLNHKDLGVFNWQPMEIDITEVCEPKRNELEIGVVNSIDSILRMNGRASGLTGEVYLDVY